MHIRKAWRIALPALATVVSLSMKSMDMAANHPEDEAGGSQLCYGEIPQIPYFVSPFARLIGCNGIIAINYGKFLNKHLMREHNNG